MPWKGYGLSDRIGLGVATVPTYEGSPNRRTLAGPELTLSYRSRDGGTVEFGQRWLIWNAVEAGRFRFGWLRRCRRVAARAHDMLGRRAWMICAYAIGMGQGTVALLMFPIYLITGEPPMGLASDIVVVGMWLLTLALAEWVVRRLALPRPLQPVITVTQAVQRRGKAHEHRQGSQPQRWPQ